MSRMIQAKFDEDFYLVNGDIVKMELDLRDKDLTFSINDECIGIVYRDIGCGEDIYYQMSLACLYSDCKVQLIEY